MNGPVLMARPLPGTVGETARVTHLFPVPAEGVASARLVSFCGLGFGPSQLELLIELAGMPCVLCLLAAPPSSVELPDSSGV